MRCNLQRSWDKPVIPYMGKGTMPKIVAQPSKLHAFNISVCDTELWLLVLEMFDHRTGQISYTWRKC